MHATQPPSSNGSSASSITAPIVIAPPIAAAPLDAPRPVAEEHGAARASGHRRALVMISVALVLAGLLATSFLLQAALITIGVVAAALSTALGDA